MLCNCASPYLSWHNVGLPGATGYFWWLDVHDLLVLFTVVATSSWSRFFRNQGGGENAGKEHWQDISGG